MIQHGRAGRNLRARVFLPVFALACLAGLAYVFVRPAVYLSSARLQIDAPASPRPDADSLPNVLIVAQALTSSAVLDQVVESVGHSRPGAVGSADALRSMLSALPVPGTNVLELRAESGDRVLPPLIVAAWIEAYRRSQADARGQSSAAALEDARGAAERLGQSAAAKRQELELFRRKHDIVSTERDENQAAARLKGLNTALNEARSREAAAEARVTAIRESVGAGRAVITPADKLILADLEKRAIELRDRMKDLEQDYTQQYLAIDNRYKAMRANLTRLEQQIGETRQASAKQALNGAEEELIGARETTTRLQQELSARKRESQDFAGRFGEQTALAGELRNLEEERDAARQRLGQLEGEGRSKTAGPRASVLSEPSVPDHPDRPDYWRDALIAVAAAGAAGLIAVWFVEFFLRSGVPPAEPVAQPIIHINYPPPAGVLEAVMPIAIGGASAQRLPETITQFPRELSGPEVRALWAAADPDARLVIAGLFGGLTLEELASLRYDDIDFESSVAQVQGSAGRRNCTLRDPFRRLLGERRAASGAAPLASAGGAPLSSADLEGLVACASCDAGLANAAEVTAEALRHTYLGYLIRQGARLAEVGEFVGRIPPASFRDYGQLSPPGPGLPLEQIEPVFPALRGTTV